MHFVAKEAYSAHQIIMTAARHAAELYSRLSNFAENKGAPLSKSEWLDECSKFLAQLEATMQLEADANCRHLSKGGRYPNVEEFCVWGARKYPQWPASDMRKSFYSLESSGWKRGKTPIINWQSALMACFETWAAWPENASKAIPRTPNQPVADIEPPGWVQWVRDNLPENWRGFNMQRWPLWSELTRDEKSAISRQMK